MRREGVDRGVVEHREPDPQGGSRRGFLAAQELHGRDQARIDLDGDAEEQHVPLARYKANLAKLVWMVSSPESPRYSPATRVVGKIGRPASVPVVPRLVGGYSSPASRGTRGENGF